MINEELFKHSKSNTFLVFECDNCNNTFQRTKKNALVSRKKLSFDFCRSCSAKLSISKKPQCNMEYWDGSKRKTHGNVIKNSENYKTAIEKRKPIHGESNPMYGKRHTQETKTKMSKSRTGKFGENSTAWKGGKQSLNKRIKKYNYEWFAKVKNRDNNTCCHCGATNTTIDAHHIKPLSIIITELKMLYNNKSDDEIFMLIKNHPSIVDSKLENGISLCRPCHKNVHQNWGSRTNPI